MKTLFGSTAAGIIIIILAVAVVLLAVTLAQTNRRLNHLSRKYRIFMKGNDGKSVEKAMAESEAILKNLHEKARLKPHEIPESKSHSKKRLYSLRYSYKVVKL